MLNRDEIIKKIMDQTGLSQKQIEDAAYDVVQEFDMMITFDAALLIVAKQYNVRLPELEPPKHTKVTKIKDISWPEEANDPAPLVTIEGVVIHKSEKQTYTRKNGTENSYYMLWFSDDTDLVKLIVWSDFPNLGLLQEKAVLRITALKPSYFRSEPVLFSTRFSSATKLK